MEKHDFIPLPLLFLLGLFLGVLSRLLDLYTANLGNIFSQLAIWILLGVILSLHCNTPQKAMIHVFLFCIGMLLSYYIMAILTQGVYSRTIMIGWTIFAFFSPIFAYCTWLTNNTGIFSFLLRIGILLVSIFSSIVLFDGFRVYDMIINGILFYVLFFQKKGNYNLK